MTRIHLFVYAVAALVVLGLSASAGNIAVNHVVKVTEKDSKISLKAGDVLQVRLQSNPSTGYGWKPAAYDKKLLKQMGEPIMEDPANKLPGAPGYQVFRFKALSAGTTSLELHYIRPWEKNTPPARVFKIAVHIDKASSAARK